MRHTQAQRGSPRERRRLPPRQSLNYYHIYKNLFKKNTFTFQLRRIMTDTNVYYDIRTEHKQGTQARIIAEIFWERQGEEISSRELQTQYGLRYLESQTGISNPTILEILGTGAILPGDLQRQVRTFYKTHRNNGLIEKNPESKRNMIYIFKPKLISEITPQVRDTRCYSREVSDNLMRKHNGCCEFCHKRSLRMAIDHWREDSI